MKAKRGFEIIRSYQNQEIHLPERKTKDSAGYDIEAAEETIIPPFQPGQSPILVKTGLKSYFPSNELLMLVNRSSNPSKKGLVLANGVGIVDADYYNNPGNEGHLMFSFYNFSSAPITLSKGERIGQGIFLNFSVVGGDNATGTRVGGFGSTLS